MKIGLVFDDSLDKSDGVQQYVLALGRWLATQGHEVHYLVGETKRADLANLHSLSRNIKVRFNGNRLSMPLPTPRRKIRELLERQQFDVLHVQVPYSPWLAAKVIIEAPPGTAIIGSFHVAPDGRLMTLGCRALAIWTRRSLRRFNHVVSVSAAAQAFARRSYGLGTEIIPNMVDYQRFHTATAFKKYADGRPTILFLGRLVPRKGCQTLLSAIDELRQRQAGPPDLRALVCGAGPLEAGLKRFCRDRQLDDIVEFTGFVDDKAKPRYYASADIAVFPSRGGESFGIVLVEAMAAGLAVLAGDNPGYRSVLNAKTQLLFAPANSQALAAKLAELLSDKAKRQALGRWGQDEARRYDTAAVGRQLVKIYGQALLKQQ